jgi:hypothetical protein
VLKIWTGRSAYGRSELVSDCNIRRLEGAASILTIEENCAGSPIRVLLRLRLRCRLQLSDLLLDQISVRARRHVLRGRSQMLERARKILLVR